MVGSKKLSQGLNVWVRRGNIVQQGWGWMLNTRWLVQRSVVKASTLVRVRVRLYRHRISMRSGSLILIHVRVVVVIRICSDHSHSWWGYSCHQNALWQLEPLALISMGTPPPNPPQNTRESHIGKWLHTRLPRPTLGEPQGFSWGMLTNSYPCWLYGSWLRMYSDRHAGSITLVWNNVFSVSLVRLSCW